MAKWGENDPRWIVENRPDGQNVNGWHWTESDWTAWAKEQLTNLLEEQLIETNDISVTLGKVTVNGEVSVNTRKKKTILFYELDVSVKWEGKLKSNGTQGKGTIQMPYISEENDDTDFEVRVSVEEENNATNSLKDLLRNAAIPFLKEKIPKMLQELRNKTVDKTKLELKQTPTSSVDEILIKVKEPVKETIKEPVKETIKEPVNEPKSTPKPKKPSSISIKLKEKFVCSPYDLYECFIHPGRVRAYAGDSSVISGEKGGKSILFGGNVQTENVELIPGKKIIQKWRFKEWPQDYYSTLTLDFETKDNKTVLNLTQEGVPESDRDRTEQGWNANYFTRIKGIFGYGSMVF